MIIQCDAKLFMVMFSTTVSWHYLISWHWCPWSLCFVDQVPNLISVL